MALVEDVIFKNPLVTEKLEQMFNNKKCCDTVFLVNEAQFHASSHLITVSSVKLDSVVDTHFENCGDREIKIGPVKHNESFLLLLKYMYGVPINFTQMDKAVMCEVLSLCELYEFTAFFNEIKSYFSTFDRLEIGNLVVLLNTSKKHDLRVLYEKCSIFAYKNAYELVTHESFTNLQYDVLCELLKSDWFYTNEIDILRNTLDWHSENVSKEFEELRQADSIKENAFQTNRCESVDPTFEEPQENQSTASTETRVKVLSQSEKEVEIIESLKNCNPQNETDTDCSNKSSMITNEISIEISEASTCIESPLFTSPSIIDRTSTKYIGETSRNNEINDKENETDTHSKSSEQIKEAIVKTDTNGNNASDETNAHVKDNVDVAEENKDKRADFVSKGIEEKTGNIQALNTDIIVSESPSVNGENDSQKSPQKNVISPSKFNFNSENVEWKSLLNKSLSDFSSLVTSEIDTPTTNAIESQMKIDNSTGEHKNSAQRNTDLSTSGLTKELNQNWVCTKCFIRNTAGDKCISCGSAKTEFSFAAQSSTSFSNEVSSVSTESVPSTTSIITVGSQSSLSIPSSRNYQFSLSSLSSNGYQFGKISLPSSPVLRNAEPKLKLRPVYRTSKSKVKNIPDNGNEASSMASSSSGYTENNGLASLFKKCDTDSSKVESSNNKESVIINKKDTSGPNGEIYPTIPTQLLFSNHSASLDFKPLAESNDSSFSNKELKGFPGAGTPPLTATLDKKSDDFPSSPDSIQSDMDDFIPTEEFKPAILMPDLITVVTGEEDYHTLWEGRCKLYRLVRKDWSERGIGVLKLLSDIERKVFWLLMRREIVLKVCCNQRIMSDFELKPLNTSEKVWTWYNHDFSDGESKNGLFALRFKTFEHAQEFRKQIEAVVAELKASSPASGPSIDAIDISGDHTTRAYLTDHDICAEANISADLIRRFSFNVLKRLLSYIRISQINALEMMRLLKARPYIKYREFLEEEKYFSQVTRARVMCVQQDGLWTSFRAVRKICSIVRTFTIEGAVIANSNTIYESVEEYEIEDCKWKIGLKSFLKPNQNKRSFSKSEEVILPQSRDLRNSSYEMYLKCTGLKNRQCTVECCFKMISPTADHPTLAIPSGQISQPVTFVSDSHVLFGTFNWSIPGVYNSINGVRTFQVVFNSFDCSLNTH